MTNFEKLKRMNVEDVAEILCDITPDCINCPFTKSCLQNDGEYGWIDWFIEEATENE